MPNQKYMEGIKNLKEQVDTYQKDGIKCLPSKRDIFGELTSEQDEGWMAIYAKVYSYYSRAIHLDMNIVRELFFYDSSKNAVLYKYDLEERDELGDLLSMSRDINILIRQFYDWDYKYLKEEYRNIIKKIEK